MEENARNAAIIDLGERNGSDLRTLSVVCKQYLERCNVPAEVFQDVPAQKDDFSAFLFLSSYDMEVADKLKRELPEKKVILLSSIDIADESGVIIVIKESFFQSIADIVKN